MEVGVELDNFKSGRVGGPTNIARTDGYTPFICREHKMQIQMDSASVNASSNDHHLPVLRNRNDSDNSSACLVSEGPPRLARSSTNSYASFERGILNNNGSSNTVSSESRLLRSNDSVLSATDARHSLRFYRPPAGIPVSSIAMGREFGVMETGIGMHGVKTGVRPPFIPVQWEELEHQALIFKLHDGLYPRAARAYHSSSQKFAFTFGTISSTSSSSSSFHSVRKMSKNRW